ncbi:hypothetical protein Tco_0241360 [Tanacetum coccineum]
MAITNFCNKHNMIACVEKTERNADFHEVIDFLTGCSVNYALLVSPDVIQQWIQQFWNTAKVRMINDVAHIEAKVAGKKILVSEATVRTDLMFNDEDGTICFDNQVIWDTLRDIGYEGSLTLLSFSKPLLSPQWKYLVHTLLHCLSSKSSSWDQFATNIAFMLCRVFGLSYISHHSDDSSTSQKAESPSPVASDRPASPNDYTPTDEVQTSGGDEGNLDLYGLSREVLSLKKQNAKQAAQILRLKTKIKILVKQVKPVIAEYSSFLKIKATLSKKKKLKKAHKQKSSSFKQGRKKVSDGSTGLNEVDVNSGDSQMMDVDDTISAEVHEGTAEVHEGTAQVNEGTAEVNERTAEANLSTEPSMKEVEDEAGPSTFQDESDEFIQDDTLIADVLVNITRPRRGAGITIPGNIPEQERPESPAKILDPKDKGKGIMKEEPKKKKLTLQQLRAAETANDEEVARKLEWEEEEERKTASLERLQDELKDYEDVVAEVIVNKCCSYGTTFFDSRFSIVQSPEGIILSSKSKWADKCIQHSQRSFAIYWTDKTCITCIDWSAYTGTGEWDYGTYVGRTKVSTYKRAYAKNLGAYVRSSRGNSGCSEFNKILVMKQKEDLERKKQ